MLRGVLGQRDRLRRRLRAAVDDHRQRRRSRKSSAARRRSAADEQDPLAGRPEREDAVQPAGREKVDVRPKGLLVQSGAVVAEWRDGCRESSAQHRAATLRCAAMAALRVERDGDVLRVTLARPERRNAFDAELIARADGGVRATSATRARSCSRAKARASVPAPTSSGCARRSTSRYEENVEDALRLCRMLEAIDSCPAPVVARVQGYALGGGCGLVACAGRRRRSAGRDVRLLRGASSGSSRR